MIKGPIPSEGITILNYYEPNNKVPENMYHNMIEM